MNDPPTRTDSIRTRLSAAQRPLAVLLCLLLISSTVPVPSGADMTSEQWRVDIGHGQEIREVVYADGVVYASVDSGRLVALDASDGSEIWNVSTNPATGPPIAVLPDVGHVYFPFASGGTANVTVLDINDGSFVTSAEQDDSTPLSLVANRNDNRVYYGASNNRAITEIDPNTAEDTGRSIGTSGNSPTSLAIGENGSVYAAGQANSAFTAKYNSELTVEEWYIDGDGASDISSSSGDLFAGTDRHSGDDGSILASGTLPSGAALFSVSAPYNATTVYAGDDNGNVTEFQQKDMAQLDTVEIFATDTVEALATADDAQTIAVFAGSDAGEVVRYDTDSLAVSGDDQIDFDVPRFMEHGEVVGYEVEATVYNTTTEQFETVDATADANVTSLNMSVITVNNNTDELIATTNTDIAEEVTVRAEYDGLRVEETVVVAELTVDNLGILPPWARLEATMHPGTSDNPDDHTFMIIVIATFTAIAGARLFTTYVGIGGYATVFIAAWLIGYTTTGMLLVVLTVVGFSTLNLAANIDYGFDR